MYCKTHELYNRRVSLHTYVPQDIGGQKLAKTDSKSCSRVSPSGHYVVAYLEIDTAGSGSVQSHNDFLPEMLILDVDGVGIHLAKSQEWHVLRINFEDQIEFPGTHEIAQGFVG